MVAQRAHGTPAQNSDPVKVGVIVPLSGEFAKWGLDVQAAIEMFEKKEPRKATFLFEDDQSCQQRAGLSAYRKLRSGNQEVFTLGKQLLSCLSKHFQ